MPAHTFDGLDTRFRGVLKRTSWTLCIGAGLSAEILPSWKGLTQEVLSRSMGMPLDDAEFAQIANGTGWGFDALLQAALNAWLARGETEEGFSTLLEESLYRTLLTEARRLGIERHVVAAFATPQLLRKDEFAGVLEFLKDKATSTHALAEILLEAVHRECAPKAIITLNYDTVLETIIRMLEIQSRSASSGRHEFPPANFWRIVGPAGGHTDAVPIIHIHGCVMPRTIRRRFRGPHDTRESVVGPEMSYSRLAGSAGGWAQTTFMNYAYSDAVVLIGQSLADPNMRRWLAWSASVRAAESSRRAKRTIEVLPHFWFKRRSKDARERVFFENSVTHLGVRVVWLDSWGQTADVMRNLLAITPPP
jgi:SIR2-like protein